MNMEDDSMDMEYDSLDSEGVEEYCRLGSQPSHSFSNGTNFYCEQIFSNKKELKKLLDRASMRHISIANSFSRVYNHAYHKLCMSEHFSKFKDKCPEAINILKNVIGFEKWSKAHFSGNRCDVMTKNITESLNLLLTNECKYPVSYIFNSIAKKFDEKFRERHAYVDSSNNKLVPCVEKILRDNKSASNSLYVTNVNGDLDQFIVFGNGVAAVLLPRSPF
ncbi:hypothetical protein CQW23_29026 [Capsicum baccatum]|uniref:Uncharacterized protein n=1 Tax=Capsicum baccatum TaxID=33114 RepID=A0A2G2VIB1_CAPBA|nr:hypothetical protein CQW23_29026 [Capsicum baccatum]